MARLSKAKEHPLLVLPKGGEEWIITARDRKRMLDALERYRGGYVEFNNAQLPLWLKELGVKDEVDAKDKEALEKRLHEPAVEGLLTSAQLHAAKKMGVEYTVTDAGRECMYKRLQEDRDTLNGYSLSHMLVNMRALGLPVEITEDDKKNVTNDLSKARQDMDGYIIAWIHYNLMELGLPTTVTQEDKKSIKEALRAVRAGKYAGHIMASLHHQIRRIMPETTTPEQQIPPLREFGK